MPIVVLLLGNPSQNGLFRAPIVASKTVLAVSFPHRPFFYQLNIPYGTDIHTNATCIAPIAGRIGSVSDMYQFLNSQGS